MNDFMEIGYWRQRAHCVERVLQLAEALDLGSETDGDVTTGELAAAVRAVREFDATESPWRRRAQLSAAPSR